MTILLAPSETKMSGGSGNFDLASLLFADTLTIQRQELLDSYLDILHTGTKEQLTSLFGLKKEADIEYYANPSLLEGPVMKAIERYTGVAFDYLDYPTLDTAARHYIDTHVLLFSNLFGPIRASDLIPEYRLKQGAPVGSIRVERFYFKYASETTEAFLQDEEILDLRAGFYDKFYRPKHPYTTLKFVKGGKVVSHWAKAYRGLVLREIAKAQATTLDEVLGLPIEHLTIGEILHKGQRSEVVYHIDS
jgi:cytoplasmic iron level regulating protein YaaA (DUF328/UPF0246 family)